MTKNTVMLNSILRSERNPSIKIRHIVQEIQLLRLTLKNVYCIIYYYDKNGINVLIIYIFVRLNEWSITCILKINIFKVLCNILTECTFLTSFLGLIVSVTYYLSSSFPQLLILFVVCSVYMLWFWLVIFFVELEGGDIRQQFEYQVMIMYNVN